MVSHIELTLLGPSDIDQILAVERASFAPGLQADTDTIHRRFGLGHTMIGAVECGRLVGVVAFSFARFSPLDRENFPTTFNEFSTMPVPSDYNAVFVYNLEVDRSKRGEGHATWLLCEALDQAKQAGCQFAVGDGRVSSYHGAKNCAQEQVKQKATLKASIDRYLDGGPLPTTEEFLVDPTLALYHRLTGCEFLWIIPDFFPADHAAGGCRVILYGELANWHGPSHVPSQRFAGSLRGSGV